jgi:hypothetical protein
VCEGRRVCACVRKGLVSSVLHASTLEVVQEVMSREHRSLHMRRRCPTKGAVTCVCV